MSATERDPIAAAPAAGPSPSPAIEAVPDADAGLAGLVYDRRNANKGTDRGRALLAASLREHGAGRSILADKHGQIIAGNKTLEASAALGIPVRVVESDGTELIVVRRTDLDLDTDRAARTLAYADNRVAELDLSWDGDVLLADQADGIDLADVGFTPDELVLLLNQTPDFAPVGIEEQGRLDEKAQVTCPHCGGSFTP